MVFYQDASFVCSKADRVAAAWACEIRSAKALFHHDLGMRERRMPLFRKTNEALEPVMHRLASTTFLARFVSFL
jgi:hypothetical protein